MLGHSEDRIGVGEVHHSDGVGVGNVLPYRPLRDQLGGMELVIVVTQEADVEYEISGQVGQHVLTDGGRGVDVRRHQF